MNKYGKQSLKVRGEIDDALRIVMDFVLPALDHKLVCGIRGQQEQDECFANGSSKKKWPDSKHNIKPTDPPNKKSDAADADPYPLLPGDRGHNHSVHFAGFVTGAAYVLHRLGEIRRPIRHLGFTSLGDWRHFEVYR